MRTYIAAVVIATVLTGCSGNQPTLQETVRDAVQVQFRDNQQHSEPSTWAQYALVVPDLNADGDALSCEVLENFYVNGRFLEGESTSSRQGPVTSSQPAKERRTDAMKVGGMMRLPLRVIGSPGDSGEIMFEIVYSVKNEATGSVLFTDTNSVTKTFQRPETQQ